MGWFFKKKEEPKIEEKPKLKKQKGEFFYVEVGGYYLHAFAWFGDIPGSLDRNPRHNKDNISKFVIIGDELNKMPLPFDGRALVISYGDVGWYYAKGDDFLEENHGGIKLPLFVAFIENDVIISTDPHDNYWGKHYAGVFYVPQAKLDELKLTKDQIEKMVKKEAKDFSGYLNSTDLCLLIEDSKGVAIWMSHKVEVLPTHDGMQGDIEAFATIKKALENDPGIGNKPNEDIIEALLDAAWNDIENG